MSIRPAPPGLLDWALAALEVPQHTAAQLVLIAGDASNRRYFRLLLERHSYVLAEAPPATEKNEAFAAVRNILATAGVRVPALHAIDYSRGFLLLEDLGDRTLLPLLSPESVDAYYQRAFATLARMSQLDAGRLTLPAYDQALLREELSRFEQWFLRGLLNLPVVAEDAEVLDTLFERLLSSALEQPRVLVHRDFHSRNLLLVEGELAVIDFQDAVVGPATYDLASLLRDCYIRWPRAQVTDWALAYRASSAGFDGVDDPTFLQWFDWMGLQRHIKVLGTFARLSLRDGKAGYLDDLPLVLRYVEEVVADYAGREPSFARFGVWFDERVKPLVDAQPWSARS